MQILVAGVGNLLRGDDGFGVEVAKALMCRSLPPGVRVVETGIGGIHLVQEMLTPYDALADMHYAKPERAFMLAKALGVLPGRFLMVGCQPVDADRLGEGLSPEVTVAVPVAVAEVERIVT